MDGIWLQMDMGGIKSGSDIGEEALKLQLELCLYFCSQWRYSCIVEANKSFVFPLKLNLPELCRNI